MRTRPLTKAIQPVWTSRNALGFAAYLVWTGSKFIAINASNSTFQYSADGIYWQSGVGTATNDYPAPLIFSNNCTALAPLSLSPKYSTDGGVTWSASTGYTSRTGAAVSDEAANAIALTSNTTGYIYTTDKGVTWAAGTLPGVNATQAVWSGNMFLVTKYGTSSCYWSTTGAAGTWTNATLPAALNCESMVRIAPNLVRSYGYSSGSVYDIDTSSGVPVLQQSSRQSQGFNPAGTTLITPRYILSSASATQIAIYDVLTGDYIPQVNGLNGTGGSVTDGSSIILTLNGTTIYGTPFSSYVPTPLVTITE